jgi:glycosyltransferase involved in cell wall biosynthesis
MRKIAVVLLTYARTDYARATLESVLTNLVAPGYGNLYVHIADDGSEPSHVEQLYRLAAKHVPHGNISTSNSERGGYGRNFNLAMQTVHQCVDYVLPLEDDWQLTRPLDLLPLLNALDGSIGVECIRLGYLSFTQALFGRVMSAPPEWYKYLLLDPASEEPHVFAGHPRLETIAYQKRVGPWPEGLPPGPTEFAVAHNVEARRGVAWPMDLVMPTRDPLFAHIGSVRSIDILEHEHAKA